MSEATALARMEVAHRSLTEASSLPEVLAVLKLTEALQQVMRLEKLGIETQNMAAEQVIRAKRKGGELLREMPNAQGRRTDLETSSPDVTKSDEPTLPELGITRRQSSTWKRIADIPADDFEEHIAETKAAGEELTTAGVLRLAERPVIDVTPRVSPPSDDGRMLRAVEVTGLGEWERARQKASAILVAISYADALLSAEPAFVMRDLEGAADYLMALAKLNAFALKAAQWAPRMVAEMADPSERALRIVSEREQERI